MSRICASSYTGLTAWCSFRLFVDEREKMEKAKVTSEVILVKGKAMQLKTSNNEVKGHTHSLSQVRKIDVNLAVIAGILLNVFAYHW